MIKKAIMQGVRILSSPKNEFDNLNKRTFEEVITDYLWLLLALAILSGIASFIFAFFNALYLNLFVDIEIQYFRMLNYTLGRAVSLLFFYIFTGTFLLFIVSLLVRPFIFKIKYIDLLKIFFYSLTPLLFFSWLMFNPAALFIWAIVLFVIGIKSHKAVKIKKDSIQQRD